MENVDLKKKEYLAGQYVQLRNSYAEPLLTSPVNLLETKEWLKRDDIEINGIVEADTLLGVVILYLERNGEIAFFVREQDKGRGIGASLLNIVEEVAKRKGLRFIWGWVRSDNISAQRAFEKSGFVKEEMSEREYRGINKEGIKYKKILNS